MDMRTGRRAGSLVRPRWTSGGDMTRGTSTPRRLIGIGAALCAVVLVAACASGAGGKRAASTDGPAASQPSGRPYSAPPAAPLRAGERFRTLQLPQAYTPAAPAGGTDEYRCFLIDPQLTSQAYLTGTQFVPQNTAIVHHAILFRIGPDQAAAARSLDASTPGEGWTCFGNAGIGGPSVWVDTGHRVRTRPCCAQASAT